MNRITLLSLTVSVFLIGCSSKDPSIDLTKKEIVSTSSNKQLSNNYSEYMNNDNKAIVSSPVSVSNSSNIETIGEITSNVNINENKNSYTIKSIDSIYFDFDQFDISEEMRSRISSNKNLLNKKFVKLEGNCDEFGSDEYNLALGLKRANAVKNELIRLGVSENYISMVSYGESNKACEEKTEECFSKNRRVDFVLAK